MSEKEDKPSEDKIKKEDDNMVANAPVIDTSAFNEFLKKNARKIKSLTEINPTIKKEDEWYKEDFWEDYDEGKNE